MYSIFDHSKFNPNTYDMFSYGPYIRGSQSASNQNPSASDRKAGVYKPRLSVRRRHLKHIGYHNSLYIEISLPKLVFGNNFDELENTDFDLVLESLHKILKQMGVMVYASQLPKANVSSIHYGKNIILEDYSTPFTYIKELKKVDMNRLNDCNQTDYRNGGLSYKFHSNLFEFTFYDKIKDLEKSKFSEKRAISKDDYCQLNLFDNLDKQQNNSKPFEVLRIEMRLNNRRKIRQTLKKYNVKENVTFAHLFNQEIAKKLILSYFDSILKQYIFTDASKSLLDTFENIKILNPNLSDGKVLELSSSQEIIKQIGTSGIRNIVSSATWRRLKKNLKQLVYSDQQNYLQNIKKLLVDFKTIHLIDYPQIMLNDVN